MLSVNNFNKVVKVEELNSDAKKVTNHLNLYGLDAATATNKFIEEATKLGYIDKGETDNTVLISTYCDNENKRIKLHKRIYDNVNQKTNTYGIRRLILDMELTEEDAKKANEYGVSEAKILFVKKAIEENPELKFEDLIYFPAKEIAQYIDGYNELTQSKDNQNHSNNQNRNRNNK